MPKPPSPPRKGLLKRVRGAFADLGTCENLDLKRAYNLDHAKVRVPAEGVPIEVALGKDTKRLWFYPEHPLQGENAKKPAPNYLVLDPDSYFSRISGFLRLQAGDGVTLGREDEEQSLILNLGEGVSRRHVSVKLTDKGLVFKNLAPDRNACLSPLLKEKKISQLWEWRRDKVNQLRQFLNGPIEPLSPEKALELLSQVNGILAEESYRPKNSLGRPGGIIQLPDHLVPIIVGDLHTQLDNLLVILTQNQFFQALQNDEACLIFIGDAVHSECDGQMEEMDSSLLIMDFILNLKARFPDRVFYLRGNHDGFSEEIGKGGVPQGILWERQVLKARGKQYHEQLQTFYQRLPYVAFAESFIACHAAAPVSKVSREELVEIHQQPKLVQEVINNRLQKSNRPGGYKRSHVKHLRKALGLGPDVPFIVGHTPLSPDDTLWSNVGDIPNHYIVYSANTHWVGVMTRIGKRMVPLKYPAEALSELFAE